MVEHTPQATAGRIVIVDSHLHTGSAHRRHEITRLAEAQGADVRLGDPQTRAKVVVRLRAGYEVCPGWLPPLLAELDQPGVRAVAPVLVGDEGTIVAAGHADGGPWLEGLPLADADGVAGRSMPGLVGGCLVMRPDVEFGQLRVVPAVAVRRHGSGPTPLRFTDPDAPMPPDPAGLVRTADGWQRLRPVVTEGPPRLRWAIKNPAPLGPRGERWGDTHFARRLAAALHGLGQHVAIDHRPGFERESGGLDDVTLVLRGLVEYTPRPENLNVLWVISHPELVSSEECARFDLVYAASLPFATAHGLRPLLQCTDPELFNPSRGVPDSGDGVLFVGNNRGAGRPIVHQAIEAGLPVRVFGARWEGVIDAAHIGGVSLPYDQLGGAYCNAGLVLGDHAPEMAAEGFISNRILDAAATGARTVSDPVVGLSELLPMVRIATNPEDLKRLATHLDGAFPSAADRAAAATRIGLEHSFAARAEQLLADVTALWQERRMRHDDRHV